MCGIAGVLGREERSVVQRMLDRIAHRGPDGEGLWSHDGITLGHRRLAIIDRATGQQPMEDHTGRLTIVYNGEIYNHLALRAELELLGHRFTNHSDTEVILEGYKEWGDGVWGRLEGMFALAMWDAAVNELVFARDLWGIKPLHYCMVPQGMAFASEMKALLAHPDVVARMNHEAFLQQSIFKFTLGPATLLIGIQSFPPGHVGHMAPGQPLRLVRIPPLPVIVPSNEGAAAVRLRELLAESVHEQLMSEVPVGVVLSGGLDSSAIAALQAKENQIVHTFTVGESPDVPDFGMAAKVARHIGSVHHEATFSAEDLWRDLPAFSWHGENIDYTVYFFAPLFRLMREVVGVGLCGQGADELWGGYSRYLNPTALASTRHEMVQRLQPENSGQYTTAIAAAHQSPAALCAWDQGAQLENYQLRLVDRHAMRVGLEVRVPFLSRSQHALSRGTSWDMKMQGNREKRVLRAAVRDLLPPEIAERQKLGAGRATGPGVVAAFEQQAERQVVPREMANHPLSATFKRPAKYLAHRVWEELFLHGVPVHRIHMEDLV